METVTGARLIILSGERKGSTCELQPGTRLTIGRHYSNNLSLRDEHCSRRHAEILEEDGKWVVRDLKSQNGTFLDGRTIDSAPLEDGSEVRIGGVRMLFATVPQAPAHATAPAPVATRDTPADLPPTSLLLQTPLLADDLSVLCRFMVDAVDEGDARKLVRQALQTAQEQTKADVVGFLGLDETGETIPRTVLPDVSKVDYHLSRTLTQRVTRDGKAIWLYQEHDAAMSESLIAFQDAICIPLAGHDGLLGALHAYRGGQCFQNRDFRFCEVLGRHLASSLRLLRWRRQLEAENSRLRFHAPVADRLIGDSVAMHKLKLLIDRAAPQSSTVLIRGESGVGKELVADALHRRSANRDGPFVVINCGAIPSTLMESQLFGHVKGAFTSADTNHEGFFQQADGGTLFLDEISELSLECQVKLLRVLETKRFTPIGGKGEREVEVRFIAATNRNLEHDVGGGRFRKDLYFRVRVIELDVPPLREHAEDIPALVDYFLGQLSARCRRRFKIAPDALDKIKHFTWPGNVRQLQYVLESAAVLSEADVIQANDLRFGLDAESRTPLSLRLPPSLNLEALERWAIEESLRSTGHQVKEAAKLLGIARDTLYRKIEKLGLKTEQGG